MNSAAMDAVQRICSVQYGGYKFEAYIAADDGEWVIDKDVGSRLNTLLKNDSPEYCRANNLLICLKGPLWKELCSMYDVCQEAMLVSALKIFSEMTDPRT